jgi:hypothetical protein
MGLVEAREGPGYRRPQRHRGTMRNAAMAASQSVDMAAFDARPARASAPAPGRLGFIDAVHNSY